jgi:hypothetical protein
MTEKRLWEVDHRYYCSETNYFDNNTSTSHKTWAEFIGAEGDADLDYNLVFRWDWREGEDWNAGEYTGDDYYRNGKLWLYFIGQRKGLFRSVEVEVCRADEPAVRAYLEPRFRYLVELWEPFALATVSA